MQRYAIVKDGLVVNVIEYESQPTTPPPGFEDGYVAIQSDVAGPGYTYANGIFTPPQPYPSWILVDNIWVAPKPMPTEGGPYRWDEQTLSWVSIGALA